MKIQYMSVIFVIIILPIILVLSAYMSFQVDSLTENLQYNTRLFEATLDGMQAFELNTVNNRFSQIADSQKRDVDAAITTFVGSLANSLGLSGVEDEYLRPFIPATLFTLYDGYYIYSPTYVENLRENKDAETKLPIVDNGLEMIEGNPASSIEYVLKPYIYYTVRYQTEAPKKIDIVVNYTLDNYIIVYGNIDGKYTTKSGFLNMPSEIKMYLNSVEENNIREKVFSVLAREILKYLKTPQEYNELRNKDYATINAELRSYGDQIEQKLMVKEIKRDNYGNEYVVDNPINITALKSYMGEQLYKWMVDRRTFDGIDIEKILDELGDSRIDEKFGVDRQVLLKLIAKEICSISGSLNSYPALIKNKAAFEVGDINNATLAELITWFGKIEYNTSNPNVEYQLKEEFGETIIEALMEEKTIANILDEDLFDLIYNNKNTQLKNKSEANVCIIDKIDSSDGGIFQVIDALNVYYRNAKDKDIISSHRQINDPYAKKYYIKSLKFTRWVNENLSTLKACDAKDPRTNIDNPSDNSLFDIQEDKSTYAIFDGHDENIFKIDDNNNPNDLTSDFSEHRMRCIQWSIQSNLTEAIAKYNVDFYGTESSGEYNLKMPRIDAKEWAKITNNIAVVTFLQGLQVGNRIYNDYAVVTSNKNREAVNTRDLYYLDVETLDKDGVIYYHRVDCPHLTSNKLLGFKNIEFDTYKDEKSKDKITYSPSDNLKELTHKYNLNTGGSEDNTDAQDGVYACYDCIINGNYTPITRFQLRLDMGKIDAEYEAIGREKEKLYKVNSYYNEEIMPNY